jgi:hypothetical protein
MSKGLAWIMGLGTITAFVLASVAAVSLTSDLRMVGFVIVALPPITAGLVPYFEWRANLLRKTVAEAEGQQRLRKEESCLT